MKQRTANSQKAESFFFSLFAIRYSRRARKCAASLSSKQWSRYRFSCSRLSHRCRSRPSRSCPRIIRATRSRRSISHRKASRSCAVFVAMAIFSRGSRVGHGLDECIHRYSSGYGSPADAAHSLPADAALQAATRRTPSMRDRRMPAAPDEMRSIYGYPTGCEPTQNTPRANLCELGGHHLIVAPGIPDGLIRRILVRSRRISSIRVTRMNCVYPSP